MGAFEQLLVHMDDGAFAVDSRRRVVFWNPACERMLGVPERDALGKPCAEVVGARDARGERHCGERCRLAGLAQGGAAPRPLPLWFGAKEGRRQPLWLNVFLVPSQREDLWLVMHLLQRRAVGALGTVPADGAQGGESRELEREPRRPADAAPKLTPREKEILGLLAQGESGAQIARRLYLSPVTVRNHVQHLISKLGLHSQLEAVAYAYRHDLVGRQSRPAAAARCVAGGMI